MGDFGRCMMMGLLSMMGQDGYGGRGKGYDKGYDSGSYGKKGGGKKPAADTGVSEAREDAAQDVPEDEELHWTVTTKKGQPVIHILSAEGHPACSRRQKAAKAKPFRRPVAMGDTVAALHGLRMSLDDRCERCWQHLDAAARDLVVRALANYLT